MATRPLVLKLGGSLLDSGQMAQCVSLLFKSPRRVVLVPGGGKFADEVRAAQKRDGFSDVDAHKFATLTMQKMAVEIGRLNPKLRTAESVTSFNDLWGSGAVPVWLPWPMVQNAPDLPQDWSVTSDGLAAWLACRIAHSEVALIKSCAVPKGASPEHLVAAGIADPTFARIVRDHALPWRVICASDTEQLTELLTGRS